MDNARSYLKQTLENECYRMKISIDVDDMLLDLILSVISDTELYDMLLDLDTDY